MTELEYEGVATLDELPPGRMKRVDVSGRDVALINVDGSVYALDNNCPHMGGPLASGKLEGEELTCPWHSWRWNVRTGRAIRPPVDWKATRIPVKIEGNRVLVAKI